MTTETEKQITERIGITPELYAELMYDSGCYWLEQLKGEVLNNMPRMAGQIDDLFVHVQRHPLFWRWWTLEWQATDRAFLRSGKRSRHDYFERQTSANRDMPQNVSIQLLKYAAKQRIPARETETSQTERGRALSNAV